VTAVLNGSRPACIPIRYARWQDHPVASPESTLIFPKQHGHELEPAPLQQQLCLQNHLNGDSYGKKVRQEEEHTPPKLLKPSTCLISCRYSASVHSSVTRESLRAIRRSASPVVIRPTQLSPASRICRSWPATRNQSFLTLASHCDTSSISSKTCSIKV
jgi:hypothetical protein